MDDDFPLIAGDSPESHLHAYTDPPLRFHSHRHSPKRGNGDEESGDGEYYSQSFAGDEDSDPNKTGSGVVLCKRNPYSYKKVKPNGNESHSGNEYRIDYRKDREEWSDTAISCLLDVYTEKFNQLNRGNLRGRDWEEVAEAVSEQCSNGGGGGKQNSCKSVEQCKNKIDNLKKRYKVEVQRLSTGGLVASHWYWFKKMEVIVGNSAAAKSHDDEERTSGGNGYMLRQSKRFYTTN